VGLAEAADIDDHRLVSRVGKFAEVLSEPPGGVVVEAGEEEFCFLTSDGGKVFGDGHEVVLLFFALWVFGRQVQKTVYEIEISG